MTLAQSIGIDGFALNIGEFVFRLFIYHCFNTMVAMQEMTHTTISSLGMLMPQPRH